MGLFDKRGAPPSDDPSDWVYEARYDHGGRKATFKFNPVEGADPEESARNIVFQDYRDGSGAIPGARYPDYLAAQASLTVRRHHQIGK